jgi:hypothetical protein
MTTTTPREFDLPPSTYYPYAYPADSIKETLREAHGASAALYSPQVDMLLMGMSCAERESLRPLKQVMALDRQYPEDRVWPSGGEDIWTPYATIGVALRHLNVTPDDVVYDLGSGYGRFILYGGIVTEAQYKGIEMLPERVEVCREAIARLQLSNVTITEGNVLGQDYSDGSVFYMYYPFSPQTFRGVVAGLKKIAAQKKITVVTRLCPPSLFNDQNWIKFEDRIGDTYSHNAVSIFRSKE